MLGGIEKLTFAGLYERQRIIVGSPEDAVALLRQIMLRTPITDFTFLVDFGLLERPLVEQSLRLLATQVVPALRQPNLLPQASGLIGSEPSRPQ